MTLAGRATADVLGVTFSLQGVRGGRATVRVRGEEITGEQGQTVRAEPLVLRFTRVTEDSVTFTASPG